MQSLNHKFTHPMPDVTRACWKLLVLPWKPLEHAARKVGPGINPPVLSLVFSNRIATSPDMKVAVVFGEA